MMFSIYLSNHIETLLNHLKGHLYSGESPFAKRLLVVPSPLMKSWILWQLVNDKSIGIAMGFEVCHLNEAVAKLRKKKGHFPSSVELALVIESEIYKALEEKNPIWKPLENYLSGSSEKRINALSVRLATLFQQYGIYGGEIVKEWERGENSGWQEELWKRIFSQENPWTYLSRELSETQDVKEQVFLFGMSWLSPIHYHYFYLLGRSTNVNLYVLSPCEEFWSDICSDREIYSLQKVWSREGIACKAMDEMDQQLFDRNLLLANCGRLGRAMARVIEETDDAHIVTDYKENQPAFLLQWIQNDMVYLRNPENEEKIELDASDDSMSIHIAPSRCREVEILHNNLLHLIERHKNESDPTYPHDIIVMAPDITLYEPYIRSVFGNSPLDYQIYDSSRATQSSLYQGFVNLLGLAKSRWDVKTLLHVFENEHFKRSNGLSQDDLNDLKFWVKKARIHWGFDGNHRSEILKRYSESGGEWDSPEIGSWKYGFQCLLFGSLVTLNDTYHDDESPWHPIEAVELSRAQQFGQWIHLLNSLYDDLKPMMKNATKSLNEWIGYLKCMCKAYFGKYLQEAKQEYEGLLQSIDVLSRGLQHIGQEQFSWETISQVIISDMSKKSIIYREHHLEAVKFCSMLPMRAIPAKIIALMGIQDGEFPKTNNQDRLNLIQSKTNYYIPSLSDFDRYLFVETLLSARKNFLISYSEEENISLITNEILDYLDSGYTLGGKKPSESIVRKHPFYPYDKTYFSGTHFSQFHYKLAQSYYSNSEKTHFRAIPGLFSSDYDSLVIKQKPTSIDIPSLCFHPYDPMRVYFNENLGIKWFEEHNDDEFSMSIRDKYTMINNMLKQYPESVITQSVKDGILPKGLLKSLSREQLENELETIISSLKLHGIESESMITVNFDIHETSPHIIEDGVLSVPSINSMGITLYGELKQITKQGLVVSGPLNAVAVYKNWFKILLLNTLPECFQRRIIFSKDGKYLDVMIDDVEEAIHKFVKFYLISQENPSMLYAEWNDDLLKDEFHVFLKKAKKMSLSGFKSPYLNKALPFSEIGNLSRRYFELWKDLGTEVYGNRVEEWMKK